MNHMTAAQAAQQSNRDNGGKYATKSHAEAAGVTLAEQPVAFSPYAGACLTMPGGHPVGVRVVSDAGGENVRVTFVNDGKEANVPREQLTSSQMKTTPKPASEVEKWELVVVDDEIYEVMGKKTVNGKVALDLDGFDDLNDDGLESFVFLDEAEEIETVDSRNVTQEVALALDPGALSDDEFTERFRTIQDDAGHDCWEDVPDGTDENRVWSQVSDFTDDGRETFHLVPGYSSGAINYVITEQPWTNKDVSSNIRVCWD